MHNIAICALIVWAFIAFPLGFLSCCLFAAGRRTPTLAKEIAPVAGGQPLNTRLENGEAPDNPSAAIFRDELLYIDGNKWVPYDPPRYVKEGNSPVAAAWDETKATGKMHHTRRVLQLAA